MNYRDNRYVGVKVLVLGASGFIGRWVARSLCAYGAHVYLAVRDTASAATIFAQYGVQGELYRVDLANTHEVRKLFQTVRPSITFNLAGYGIDRNERNQETAYQVNAYLVETICEAIAEEKNTKERNTSWSGQDVVHVGTALEYGAITGNLAEDSPPHPTTLYGMSKLEGTLALSCCCRKYGLKGITARLFTVYGPGEHPGRLLPSILEASLTDHALEFTAGTQKRDFTYVEDVAEALVCLSVASARTGETINLATGQLSTVRSFVEAAAKTLSIPQDRLMFSALPMRPEEMAHSTVTIERLRQLIRRVPSTSIIDGIRKTAQFQRSMNLR
jgi:UDP-glucose 4-epimerase